MLILIALILLVGSATSYSLNGQTQNTMDYRLSRYFSDTPNEKCENSPPLVCKDCTTVGLCKKDNDNEWIIDDLLSCPIGETCINAQCQAKEDPECSPIKGLKFICTTTGMFPDPGDCKLYHFCVLDNNVLKEFPGECPEGYAYNAKTTFCDKSLSTSNGKCTAFPIPLCKKEGERGVVKENQTYYYMCVFHPDDPSIPKKILYPVIFACPNGKIYNPITGECK